MSVIPPWSKPNPRWCSKCTNDRCETVQMVDGVLVGLVVRVRTYQRFRVMELRCTVVCSALFLAACSLYDRHKDETIRPEHVGGAFSGGAGGQGNDAGAGGFSDASGGAHEQPYGGAGGADAENEAGAGNATEAEGGASGHAGAPAGGLSGEGGKNGQGGVPESSGGQDSTPVPEEPDPGPTTDPPQLGGDFVSGSRLKVRFLTSADGARQPVGWYDAQLGEPCTPVKASDGKTRCLPLNGSAVYGGVYYADADCREPVFFQSTAGACDASYGYTTTQVSCGGGYEMYQYEIYQLMPFQPSQLYSGGVGSCTQLGSIPQGYKFYRGTRIQPSAFAELNEVVE